MDNEVHPENDEVVECVGDPEMTEKVLDKGSVLGSRTVFGGPRYKPKIGVRGLGDSEGRESDHEFLRHGPDRSEEGILGRYSTRSRVGQRRVGVGLGPRTRSVLGRGRPRREDGGNRRGPGRPRTVGGRRQHPGTQTSETAIRRCFYHPRQPNSPRGKESHRGVGVWSRETGRGVELDYTT